MSIHDAGLEYFSWNWDSKINGPVAEVVTVVVSDIVEPKQTNSSSEKRSRKIGIKQFAYNTNTKENNNDMNEVWTDNIKEGIEPIYNVFVDVLASDKYFHIGLVY